MKNSGYYRSPSIHGELIVFVSEDDLWEVPAAGGTARRLTSGLGSARLPSISPDGRWIAFTGREEGPGEVYVMPAAGGQARRVTFTGVDAQVCGWADANSIVFASSHALPFEQQSLLYTVSIEGGRPEVLKTGPAINIAFGAGGTRVIERTGSKVRDMAWWKRYRGGKASDLWIDPAGKGGYRRLVKIDGHAARPMWVGGRVYFVADHESVGNLYSVAPSGKYLKRHTSHHDFYARNPSTDGKHIVYHAGADLYVFDPASDTSHKVDVRYPSPRTGRNRKFAECGRHLSDFALDATGTRMAISSRGQVHALGCFDGPVLQHGGTAGARYTCVDWLKGDKRLVAFRRSSQGDGLELLDAEGLEAPVAIRADVGRVLLLKASPDGKRVAVVNHRNELVLVNLETKKAKVVEKCSHRAIYGLDWSPDSKWLAYDAAVTQHTAVIKLYSLDSDTSTAVTRPVLADFAPAFDPDGRYLYFISVREFDPVYDSMHFELGFPRGMKPYLITLRKELESPFTGWKAADAKKEKFRVDLEGIQDRVIAFPVPDGRYLQIAGLPGGKVLYASVPILGSLGHNWFDLEPAAKGSLECYDFAAKKTETLLGGISSFTRNESGKHVTVRAGNRLRVLKAGEKAPPDSEKDPRIQGWLDLARVRVAVEPQAEWRQMFDDAWGLQSEHFWDEAMSSVDWKGVHERYAPLLDRLSCRSEFADLVWEMQGELGTSHAYEGGGDYRDAPRYDVGFLGAEFAWNAKAHAYGIERIVRGDGWDEKNGSPLLRPGVNVAAGDLLMAINGRRLSEAEHPCSRLVHQAGLEVQLTLSDKTGKNRRNVRVKTLASDRGARYREWVERNRAHVHARTGGKVGYVHIPNMGPVGFAEFHRGFLAETDREGLVVDARFNGGGHVSPLLLEKLARRRIAWCQSRWLGVFPYPEDSPAGPMCALTNEYAGSDGDIFSHAFKMMKLGPLIGKRTWGGVVGINPRSTLADGGLTTQPEYSFWFNDVGWTIENHGVDPDIELEIRPQDYLAGTDPQLDRGIREVLARIKREKPRVPDFGKRPMLGVKALARKAGSR